MIVTIDAHLSDLAGEIAGRLGAVAERMIRERYGSASRRRHYNRRTTLDGSDVWE